MNLIEFIRILKDEKKVHQYMNDFYPNIDYYDAEVYLKHSLDKNSDLIVFDGNKIEGMIKMEIDNIKYYNLFSLDLLLEVFEDYYAPLKSDTDIANSIISYRINDA